MINFLNQEFERVQKKFPNLSAENFNRIALLTEGIDYNNLHSYPDPFTHIEAVFSAPFLSTRPVLTLCNPSSPFSVITTGNQKVLFYKNGYVSTISQLDLTTYDLKKKEPFYFYVREINNDLVLKLNPMQLCDFFQNSYGNVPCVFCFRNDMISRFRNIKAVDLITQIVQKEKENHYKLLSSIDELSLITGSYDTDETYVKEVSYIVGRLKRYIPTNTIITVGSHEAKETKTFKKLYESGVTRYAFPIESLSNKVRTTLMKNRKGKITIEKLIEDVHAAIDIFGKDNVIIRLVAGMGDPLDEKFHSVLSTLANLDPTWNINVFTPFTHYLWKRFKEKPFFTKEYLFEFCSIVNQYIDPSRFISFKISP